MTLRSGARLAIILLGAIALMLTPGYAAQATPAHADHSRNDHSGSDHRPTTGRPQTPGHDAPKPGKATHDNRPLPGSKQASPRPSQRPGHQGSEANERPKPNGNGNGNGKSEQPNHKGNSGKTPAGPGPTPATPSHVAPGTVTGLKSATRYVQRTMKSRVTGGGKVRLPIQVPPTTSTTVSAIRWRSAITKPRRQATDWTTWRSVSLVDRNAATLAISMSSARMLIARAGGQRLTVQLRWVNSAGMGPIAKTSIRVPRSAPTTPRLSMAVPGIDARATRILPAVQPPAAAGPYKFLAQRKGRPITFSPCRQLDVVVNLAHAPAGSYELVADVVATLRAATGLALTLAGETSETPRGRRALVQPERYGPRWAPIVISWAKPASVPAFRDRQEPIVGLASNEEAGKRKSRSLITGQVTMNADYFAKPDRRTLHAETLLHEFGHVLGLAHVSDSHQVMNATVGGGASLGSGDLAGLALLGQGRCTPQL